MWKCKKCGSNHIVGRGYVTGGSCDFIPPNKTRIYLSDCERRMFDLDVVFSRWVCEDCGTSDFEIEDIAIWEDNVNGKD